MWARLAAWWQRHRPIGGTMRPTPRDLHRDPLIRQRGRHRR